MTHLRNTDARRHHFQPPARGRLQTVSTLRTATMLAPPSCLRAAVALLAVAAAVCADPEITVQDGDLLLSVGAGQDVKLQVGDGEPASLASLVVRSDEDRTCSVAGNSGCFRKRWPLVTPTITPRPATNPAHDCLVNNVTLAPLQERLSILEARAEKLEADVKDTSRFADTVSSRGWPRNIPPPFNL